MKALPSVPAYALLLALASCEGCRDPAYVAELASTAGAVQRDFDTRLEQWQPARVGAAFAVGDGLRTGAGAIAELKLEPDGRLKVEAETIVRFSKAAPEHNRSGLLLVTGAVELELLETEYDIAGPGGRARLQPGSRARLQAGARGTHITVDVGRVQVERAGHLHDLGPGDSFDLQVGALTFEHAEPERSPVEPVQPEIAHENAPLQAEVERGFDVPPAYAELELPAGESATVHDPKPPTAVRVSFAGCQGGLALEVVRTRGDHVTRVRGIQSAIASLPTGQFRYRVYCAQPNGSFATRAAAEGRLTVLRDAATKKLPTAAPAVSVNADGRKYTVRYQNLPPVLTVRWPQAPKASAYHLELRAAGRPAVRERAVAPSVTLSSGRIEEGTYLFRFEADGMRSPEGTISVVFDDTARVAYLSEPHDHGFSAGESVRVAGAALRGARVEAEGTQLTMAGQSRFDTRISLSPERRALAVRVQHAATGVHYFVRHAAGSDE
jgi:hypothetical protein